jgi:hypothetical protein
MKRFCFLAVLMALSSSAYAGGSISFSVGGHRVHIESSRHCRSTSCASVSLSGVNGRRKRDRSVADREEVTPVRTAPPAPQTVSPPPAPAAAPPAPAIVASSQAVYRSAASTTQIVAEPPPPPVPQVSIPLPPPPPPPPPVAKPVEPVRPAAPVARVSHEADEVPADSPIGDWQTEGKGTVRIAKCGNALCGYVLNSSNDKGEAILINMKPKTDRQWTGSVYSKDSGDTYYGTMAIKGINTLRVEACAFSRFYCSGNNWSRIAVRADNLVTSRQVSAEPRS